MAISRRRARNGGSDGLVFPAAFVALVLLIYFIALPPALPPGMATPLTGGLQIYTLAPSASTTSAVPGNASLDVLFHRLSDKFGLVDSGLSDAEILHLIRQIRGIWQAAGVDIRIDEKQALVVRRLEDHRAMAYLFYVFGHPRIAPNERGTQLSMAPQTTSWVLQRYQGHVAQALAPLHALARNARLMAELNPPVSLSEFQKLARKYELANALAAFVSMAGNDSGGVLTAQALDDVVAVSHKPVRVRQVHIAFRRFYFDHGLSPDMTFEFAAAMKSQPQLFLNYAIGRDESLTVHEARRSTWEKRNTLAVYPVAYFADMNSRGSPTFMDVVVRTSSCFVPRNLSTSGAPVRCRWGVRPWEHHRPSASELARAVAKDIGACLGLAPASRKCLVAASADVAPLMQPERSVALQAWLSDKACSCVAATCVECGCRLTDAMLAQMAAFTALSPGEASGALAAVAIRDVAESDAVPGSVTQGPRLDSANDGDAGATWVRVQGGDALVLTPAVAMAGRVKRVRVRATASPRQEITIAVQVARGSRVGCAQPWNGRVVETASALVDGRRAAHWELDVDLEVRQGDVLEVAVLAKAGEAIKVLASASAARGGCVRSVAGGLATPLSAAAVLVNYDLVPDPVV